MWEEVFAITRSYVGKIHGLEVNLEPVKNHEVFDLDTLFNKYLHDETIILSQRKKQWCMLLKENNKFLCIGLPDGVMTTGKRFRVMLKQITPTYNF